MLESLFSNASFALLLGSFIFYWVRTILTGNNNPSQTSSPVSLVPSAQNEGTPQLAKEFAWGKYLPSQLGTFSMMLANGALASLMVIRWYQSGHFPLSNLFESLIFLSWCCTVLHLVLETSLKEIGALTAPTACWLQAFANFSLPNDMQQSSPLVPALQSNWLMMHVTVMLVSYAALLVGSLLSMGYLVLLRSKTSMTQKNKSFQNTLDQVSYRLMGIGFAFLTIGILSGAVWANEAWGSYWSWDPKETWALLTWLVFAIYLHTRLNQGWSGEKPAWIASLGFFTVWVCFLGVNLMGEGLHSYGFFSSSWTQKMIQYENTKTVFISQRFFWVMGWKHIFLGH